MAFDDILYYLHSLRILPPILESIPPSQSSGSRRVVGELPHTPFPSSRPS